MVVHIGLVFYILKPDVIDDLRDVPLFHATLHHITMERYTHTLVYHLNELANPVWAVSPHT